MTSPINLITSNLIQLPDPPEPTNQQIDGTKQKISKVKNFGELKQLVKIAIEKCPIDTELHVLQKTLQPDPSIIDHHCKTVTNDLQCILLPLGPKQIDLFGSTAMGVAFKGMSKKNIWT